MANWDSTTLKCNNVEVMKACAAALKNSDRNDGAGWNEGDMEIYVSTRWGIPHDKVKEVSNQFPDDVIVCKYSFECDYFSEIHTVEYRNGQGTEVDIEPSYMYNPIPLKNEKDQKTIYEKAAALYKKLDAKEKKEDGSLSIKWFDEEICYKFEHDGEDGKKYRIETTKQNSLINFKVFEGIVKYDWKELDDEPSYAQEAKSADDCPF